MSYVWGDPKPSHTVTVNGYNVAVTQNLVQSLHRLRRVDEPFKVWVDALCINQADVHERNIQVQRIGRIFGNASKVMVFLGAEAEESPEAIKLLVLISQFALGDHEKVEALLMDEALTKSWQALFRLFRRPWWNRAWIVQEYAVAKNVVFLCGTEELDGKVFAQALENLIDYRFRAIVPRKHEYLIRHVASTPIHHLWSTRCRCEATTLQNDLHALEILYKFRGSQCSDPRDKVFSIFSLAKQDSLPAPDYTKATAQVFKEVVKAAIQTSGTLEILTHHNQSKISELNLPTWCPDWTILRGKRILLCPNGYNTAGKFTRANVEFLDDSLALRGVDLDRIKYLRVIQSNKLNSKTYIHHELDEFVRLACQAPFPESDTGHRLDTIYRTFVADRIWPGGARQKAVILGEGQGLKFWDAWSKQLADDALLNHNENAKHYAEALYSALCGRSLLLTESGRVGLVDGSSQVGDQIYVFSGGQVLFCIRSDAALGRQRHKLVGECYIHGLMDGEAVNGIVDEESLERVILV
ncbi:MAG: hypothetical protein M1822_006030 [Bathelium mastoideum]|nr:MAG: hypothetical protein M1822_006030 [Bathelium mastoideum]